MTDEPDPTDELDLASKLSLASKSNPADEPVTTFNLEETIAAVQSFYEFLIRMHAGVDTDDLRQPPEGGWPQIKYDCFRKMGYNDRTIHLIRHLPYFRYAGWGGRPQIMSETWTVDWPDNCPQRVEDVRILDPDQPPHIVVIALADEYGYTVYFDTNRGTVIRTKNDYQYPGTTPPGDLNGYPYEGDLDLDEIGGADIDIFNAWQFGGTFRVKTFFDACKERFSSLTWIPIMEEGNQGEVIELNHFDQVPESIAERQEILRGAGWPGDGWDKDKAIRETTEWRRQWDKRYRY